MLTGALVSLIGCAFLIALFVGARRGAAIAFGARKTGTIALDAERESWDGVSFGKRAAFTAAGPFAFYVGLVIIFTTVLAGFGTTTVDDTSMRVAAAPGGPAARAGIVDGDKIVDVAGVPIRDWETLKRVVTEHLGEPIDVTIDRGGSTVVVHPTVSREGKIMVGPPPVHRDVGFGEALGTAIVLPPRIWGGALGAFVRLLRGADHPELSGPVGIVREVDSTAKKDGLAASVRLVGALGAYFAWGPLLFALITFPRKKKRPA